MNISAKALRHPKKTRKDACVRGAGEYGENGMK